MYYVSWWAQVQRRTRIEFERIPWMCCEALIASEDGGSRKGADEEGLERSVWSYL